MLRGPRLRTGNLGVAALRAAWHGDPPPDPAIERSFLPGWRARGFEAVEDYVSWAVVEPRPGAWDFALQEGNARAARAAGLAYWVYLWLHVSPPWFRATGSREETDERPAFEPMRCLEHGCASPFPSLHAPGTARALERFYAAAADALGALADGVVVGFPADYGELGYPSGVADWILRRERGAPAGIHHPGFWCGEPAAEAAFRAAMRARHGDGTALAARWELAPEALERSPWPRLDGVAPAHPLHRDDAIAFYQEALGAWTERALALAAERFPGRPLEVKVGHCSEDVRLGRDLGALVAFAGARGARVRSTQSGMEELFGARLASLCRTAGAAFATEGPRVLGPEAMARRAFADAAQGALELFEYPEQLESGAAALAALEGAWGRAREPSPLAAYYPTRCLVLEPGLGVWDGIAASWPALARVAPLECLDERQLASGALEGCAALLLTAGVGAGDAAETLPPAVESWVRAGGVLVRAGGETRASGGTSSGSWLDADAHAQAPRYHLDAPLAARVVPGEPAAAPWLGPGWLGLENGASVWPDAGALVPVRWTGGEAHLLVPRPAPGALRLYASVFVPEGCAPARLEARDASGRARASAPFGPGRHELALEIPAFEGDDVLRVVVASGTHRPDPARDRRSLGVLVRRVALVPAADAAAQDGGAAAARREDEALAAARGVRLRAPFPARRLGAGLVLRGEGSNLFVLAALRTWLAGALDGPPPPALARDLDERCQLARLAGGLLVHNPDARAAHRPRLEGDASPNASIESLAPLETRWLPDA